MIPFSLAAWAIRHHVSEEALDELRLGVAAGLPPYVPPPGAPNSEAHVQSLVRLEAPRMGCYLFRNNVGALTDETGRVVRYGLANDSAAMNRVLKSSDLIGWRRVLIEPRHVGRTIAQFLARECKRVGWVMRNDPHEQAQSAFIHLVQSEGGDAGFTTGPGSL